MKFINLASLFLCSIGSTAMTSNSWAAPNVPQPGTYIQNHVTHSMNQTQALIPLKTIGEKKCHTSEDSGILIMFQFNGIDLLHIEVENDVNHHSKSSHIFPKGTVLSIATAPDPGKLTVIRYQMDEAPEQPYFESLRLMAKGEHTIKLIKIDSLGTEYPLGPIKFKIVE